MSILIDRDRIGDDRLPGLVESESRRAAELGADGTIVRLWRPVNAGGRWQNIGLWRASDRDRLMHAIRSLPLFPWMTIQITELDAHPADPPQASEGV